MPIFLKVKSQWVCTSINPGVTIKPLALIVFVRPINNSELNNLYEGERNPLGGNGLLIKYVDEDVIIVQIPDGNIENLAKARLRENTDEGWYSRQFKSRSGSKQRKPSALKDAKQKKAEKQKELPHQGEILAALREAKENDRARGLDPDKAGYRTVREIAESIIASRPQDPLID